MSGEISGKNAGVYTVTLVPIGNCTWKDDTKVPKQQTWEIKRDIIPAVPSQNGTLTYNRLLQSPTLDNYDSTKMILSGDYEEKINAGVYTAYATPDDNHCWSDTSTDSAIFTWEIQKAHGQIITGVNAVTLDNETDSTIIYSSRAGDGEISVTTTNSDVAAVSISDTDITIKTNLKGTATVTIDVAEGTNHTTTSATIAVTSTFISPLNQCTPAEILDAVKSTKAPTAWNIGDTTSAIPLNGQIGAALTLDNFEVRARLIGFDHNKNLESGGKSSATFALDISADGKDIAFVDSNYSRASADGTEYFQHSLTQKTNAGGWESSNIRTKILADIFAAIPQDWQDVIGTCTKYTDNIGDGATETANVTATQDKLFLLSEFEVFGNVASANYANSAERNFQSQYEFFKNGNSRIRYKHDDSEPCYWWLRSLRVDSGTSFCRIDDAGIENTYTSQYSQGIVAAFTIF